MRYISPLERYRQFKEQEGFTLAELLVVVVILVVLAALAVPMFLGQVGKAKDARAKTNVANAAQLLGDARGTNGSASYDPSTRVITTEFGGSGGAGMSVPLAGIAGETTITMPDTAKVFTGDTQITLITTAIDLDAFCVTDTGVHTYRMGAGDSFPIEGTGPCPAGGGGGVVPDPGPGGGGDPPACSAVPQQAVSVPSGLMSYSPAVAYSPSGQLYLVGSIYIRRYNTDYTPDASWNFDSTGLDIGSTLGIFPLTNGRVLVWGNRSNSPWAAILNNDGSINKTLALNYSVRRAAEGSDGSFYLNQSAWGAIISKYSADGEVDTSFASTIALNFPSFETVNFAVIPSGKYAGQILVSGRQTIESRQYGTLLRFNSDGTLNRRLISIRDTWVQSFAHDTNTNSNLYTLSSGWHISVGRIDENGDPDRTFNNGGANPLLLGDSRGVGEHLEIRTIVRDRFGRYYLAGVFGNPQHVTYDGVSARGAGFMSPGTGGSPMWVIDDNGTLDRQWGTRIFNDCTTATHGFNVRDAIGGGYWRPNGLSIAVSPGGDRIAIVAAGAGKFAGLLPYAGSMDYPTGFGDSAGLYLFRDDGVPSKVG